MEGLQADSSLLHQGLELFDFQSGNFADPLTSLGFSDGIPFLQMLTMEPFTSPFPPPEACLRRPWPAVELESCITETHSPVKSEAAPPPPAGKGKRKRKRPRPGKNKEETESQRMTHIAVERNRRKTMNNHLAALRSLMPASFVQRGDQASIVGGAIDFVKELEQLLQSLEAEKRRRDSDGNGISPPFNGFFTSPQYRAYSGGECTAAPAADVEVAVVQSHVSVKVLAPRRPGRLVKAIAGLEELSLTILHLNITSLDHSVLYSFNLKIEEECKLVSADEIATAVYQIFSYINTD